MEPINTPIQKPTFSWLARLLLGRDTMDGVEMCEPDLAPSGAFRAELEREMLRSDRTNSPLTLVVFDVTCMGKGRKAAQTRRQGLELLAEAVTSCSRRTDYRGWYRDPKGLRIGLILHHTEADRAAVVIEKVRRCFIERATEALAYVDLVCEIYGYPGIQKGAENGPEQLWLFDEAALGGYADPTIADKEKEQRTLDIVGQAPSLSSAL